MEVDVDDLEARAEQFLQAVLEAEAPPEEEANPLTRVDISDVMTATPVPPQYIVEPWVPRRHVTLFGGHGGTGKTTLALAVAAHACTGDSFAGMTVEQGEVLYVSLEDDASVMRYRLRLIIEEYQLNHFKVLENLTLFDGTESHSALVRSRGESQNAPAVTTTAYDQVRKLAVGKSLVVIDNASDAFDANENMRRQVRSFIRALSSIARENNSAVMLLAHIDKNAARNGSGGNSYSGSTAWHNSSRSRLALLDDCGSLTVEQEKLNVGRRADPLPLAFSAAGVPIPLIKMGEDSAPAEGQDRRDMLKCFEAAASAGISIPTKLVPGAHSAMSALASLEEYPAKFQGGSQGGRLASKLLTAMKREGVLVEEEYRKQNRHQGTRLVVSPELQKCANTLGQGAKSSDQRRAEA